MVNATKYITYTYDVTGVLIRKQMYDNSVLQKTTDYVDGFVYENNALMYFPMAEGRVRNNSGTLKYEYIIADNMGNARVSFEDNGSGIALLTQENSYYPYGLTMPGNYTVNNPANNKLYNGGSEWQNDFSGLPEYYSTFYRNYDPALGRFISVDPKADATDDLSSYHYAGNNPILFNDPLGDRYQREKPIRTRPYGGMDFGGMFGGGPASGGGHWYNRYARPTSGLDAVGAVNNLLNTQYGGSWSTSNGMYAFKNADEAWNAGADYLDYHNAWGIGGAAVSRQSARYEFNSIREDRSLLIYKPTGNYYQRDANGVFYVPNTDQVANPYTGQIQSANKSNKVDWRGVGEASLSIIGGGAEIVLAVGGEWFSGGLATPLATIALADGATRASVGMIKLMAAIGGKTEARNLPGSIGAWIGMGIDQTMGTKHGQQIGGLVNDAITIFLTGGFAGNLETIFFNPSVPAGIKALSVGAQIGSWYDGFNNGGVIK